MKLIRTLKLVVSVHIYNKQNSILKDKSLYEALFQKPLDTVILKYLAVYVVLPLYP